MKKTIIKILIFILLIVFIISLYKIITYLKDNKDNKNINDNINKNLNINNIDFNNLKKINKDIVAYLKVNNTNINYIVVQTNNNNYYLNHNLLKNKNISGWIFIDYRNKLDKTDKNIIIYGHDTKDKSMFGSLKNVLEKDWYLNKSNHNITFITEKSKYTYKIFSIYTIKVEDYYLKTDFNNDYLEFLNTIKSRSIYNFNVNINDSDKILTLSTCMGNGSKRVVVHAKLVKD